MMDAREIVRKARSMEGYSFEEDPEADGGRLVPGTRSLER